MDTAIRMADEVSIFSMALWTMKEGREEEFMEAWTDFARWTNEHQRGTLGIYLMRERSNPHVLVTFGGWESDDDLLRWRGSGEYGEFLARARELCSEVGPLTLDLVATMGMPQLVTGA